MTKNKWKAEKEEEEEEEAKKNVKKGWLANGSRLKKLPFARDIK